MIYIFLGVSSSLRRVIIQVFLRWDSGLRSFTCRQLLCPSLEAENCHRNGIRSACISIGGLSKQYIDLKDQILEEISAVNAWKVSVKPGHSFGARGTWSTTHGTFQQVPKSHNFTAFSIPVSRGTSYVCHSRQPCWKCQSCCVICMSGRWHMWLVLISQGSEMNLLERSRREQLDICTVACEYHRWNLSKSLLWPYQNFLYLTLLFVRGSAQKAVNCPLHLLSYFFPMTE